MQLFSKTKKSGTDVQFSPELSIHHIENSNASHDVFRVNPRDHWNQTKNIKVPSADVTEMNIELDGFDVIEGGFIKGKVFLNINSTPDGKITLCENCIKVDPNANPLEAKNAISEIWADEFTNALDQYKESLGLSKNASSRKKRSKQDSQSAAFLFSKDNWVNIICGITLLGCIGFFATTYFNKNKTSDTHQKQTILQDVSDAAKEQTNFVNNSTNSDHSVNPDDDALQEFGLEKGLSLDVNEN